MNCISSCGSSDVDCNIACSRAHSECEKCTWVTESSLTQLTDGLDCCDSDCSILVLNNWSSQNVPVLLKYDGNSNLHFKNYRSRAFWWRGRTPWLWRRPWLCLLGEVVQFNSFRWRRNDSRIFYPAKCNFKIFMRRAAQWRILYVWRRVGRWDILSQLWETGE